MKNIFTLWLFLVPCFGFGQVVDTVSVRREVDSLIDTAIKFYRKNKFESALTCIDTAFFLADRYLSQEERSYINLLNIKGRCFHLWGRYTDAEAPYLKAKLILENNGIIDERYASIINNLANLYFDKSDYDKAELMYQQTVSIREKKLGKKHPDYASALSNLALLYREKGYFEKSEQLHLEAKTIRSEVSGKEHPDYAASLNNLANFYKAQGNYEKSEQLFLESISIRGKALGKDHLDYAQSLFNLASVYHGKGDIAKALVLNLQAKDIVEKALGKEHPIYALCLNNLANLYDNMGNYSQSENLNIEALALREKTLGKEHLLYASSLDNLAKICKNKGDYDKAEQLHLEAKSIKEKILGKENPDYAVSLNGLGNVYLAKGDYSKSELSYLESKTIREKTLGKHHPHYAMILNNLAHLYRSLGDFDKSENFFLASNLAVKNLLQKSSTYNSEKEVLRYQNSFQERFENILSFTQTCPTDSLSIAAYDNALFLNIALLETATARENAIRQTADSSTHAIYFEWKSLHFRLSKQYTLPIAERDSALIVRLEEKANAYEKELVRLSEGFAQSRIQVQWSEVRNKLRPHEAAIEFIHYRYHDQKARATDSTLYAALVLLPTDTAPHFIPLCEQRQLDALIAHTPDREQKLYLQDVYWPRLDGQPSLYQLLWAPLDSLLNSPSVGGGQGEAVKTVYYSPSGLLHRLNLSAIGLNQRTNISDKYRLVALGSTRQLVVGSSKTESKNPTAVVYGGIRYDMDSTAIVRNNAELSLDSTASEGSGLFKYAERNQRTRGGELWDYLPGTETEANNVRDILKRAGISTTLRKGYAATEESFKQLGKNAPSPRILHIATHGFFFPDPKDTVGSRQLAIGSDREPAFKISEHPMIRSGLMLAGSQYAWDKGHPLTGMEDGILTAYEVSHTNLSGTELVVLSACETGLGDIQGNEGVYGLQRAFKIAGAKYVLMSLWQVPDEKTQELMTSFYRKWLEEKMPLPEAFEAAQQEMREKYRSPFYWAGFVLVG